MKILSTLLVLIMPLIASAAGLTIKATTANIGNLTVPALGGGACNTVQTNQNDVVADFTIYGPGASPAWMGTWYTPGANYTVCKITAGLKKVQDPAFSIYAGIYTDNTGSPGTLVGSWSDAVAATSLSTSFSTITFNNVSASLTSGTKYWVVIKTVGTRIAGDQLNWQYSNNFGADRTVYKSDDGTTWTQENNYSVTVFAVYSQ